MKKTIGIAALASLATVILLGMTVPLLGTLEWIEPGTTARRNIGLPLANRLPVATLDALVFTSSFQRLCGTSSTLLTSTSCREICLRNTSGTQDIFFGATGVTITTGQLLPQTGASDLECVPLTANANEVACVAGVAATVSVSCKN